MLPWKMSNLIIKKKKKLNGIEVLSFDILPDSVIDSLCPAQVPVWARTDTIMANK